MGASVVELIDSEGLRALADDISLRRGAVYAREGRVEVIDRSNDLVRALVRGGERYMVELLAPKGKLAGRCSCPVSQGRAFCKHCVAVALSVAANVDAAFEKVGTDECFETDADVDAFIQERGIEHLRKLGAEVLLPFLPERERASLKYVLGRQRLMDFASARSIQRYGYALAHAPKMRELIAPAAFEFLQRESVALLHAKADGERVTRSEDPDADALFAPLAFLRAHYSDDVAPRAREALFISNLRFTDTLPGFEWTDERPWVGERFGVPVLPSVELILTPERAKVTCSQCTDRCEHALAAIDAALLWLQQPITEERRALLKELRRPAWERALRAIEHAMTPAETGRGAEFVSWRIAVYVDEGVTVEPWLHRITKRGVPSAGTRTTPSRLLEDYASILSPEDQRIASLAKTTFSFAERPLLMALVGHPRVVLAQNPNANVRVEAAKIGLLADHRGDSVVLVPALDGARLPDHLLKADRNRRGSERAMFLFEEEARRLTVLEFPEEVRRTLEALTRYGNDFPPESHAALVEKLSALSARVPVAMPRTVMGEAVAPQTHVVLRLEVQPDGSVRVEVRIRPLPESAAFEPGEGARDVHVRRDGKPLHAKRDFVAELNAAKGVWERMVAAPLDRLGVKEVGPGLKEVGPGENHTAREPNVFHAELIEAAPFTLLLPTPQDALAFISALDAWDEHKPELEWISVPLKVVARAQATALKVTLERKRDWFGAKGGLAIEGERISLAVLLDAARRKERFVQIEGHNYVEVGEALRRHLERLADHTYRGSNGLELGPAAVDVLHALENEGAKVDADKTWRALAERIFASKELKPRVPSSLKAELRDYQLEGFQWLTRLASWGAGAVLADDMGLGKTVQALAVLLDRAKLGPALVVAPTSVGFNWVDEAKRFAPSLRMHVYAESGDRGGTLESLKTRDVLVLSYGLLARDINRLSKLKFATIVLDEAQALKNAATHRARAARELQGDFKFALSGTPLENHLGELWSLYRIVFPGLLGSWEAFRDRFAMPIEKHIDPTAGPALSRVLQPFLLRRTKDQVARELPERTDQRIPVVLSPEEWQLYEDARLAALSDLETPKSQMREQQRRIQVLSALTRLRLLASHPRLYDASSTLESSKLKRLLELIDELREEGHRALVFSQFTSHLALVREVLDERGVSYLYLDGQTPRKERERLVNAFQNGDAPLFLISLKAGGFGLNLTGADNVIHLDPWWNPAVEDQASDRAHRIGQHRPVTIYRLVSKGTIEEQILALHEDKRQLVTGVLEGTDQAARLSTTELLTLLSTPAARSMDMESPSTERH